MNSETIDDGRADPGGGGQEFQVLETWGVEFIGRSGLIEIRAQVCAQGCFQIRTWVVSQISGQVQIQIIIQIIQITTQLTRPIALQFDGSQISDSQLCQVARVRVSLQAQGQRFNIAG